MRLFSSSLKHNKRHSDILILTLLALFVLVSCTSGDEPPLPDCDDPNGIAPAPTREMQTDPDIWNPPAPPGGGGDLPPGYCPPTEQDEEESDPLEEFISADVVNATLDIGDQGILASAIGDDALAVAWQENGMIEVAITRGGTRLQPRPIDEGNTASMMFSKINRLHVAYEKNGEIYYVIADQNEHPADFEPIFVDEGYTPQVVIDELNWAHVIYERDGSIYKAKHLSGYGWFTQFVAYGTNPSVMAFYNDKELEIFGIPTDQYWFGVFLASYYNGSIRIFRYLSWFNLWEQIASFPIPGGEELLGRAYFDFFNSEGDDAWVYLSWVNKRDNSTPPPPIMAQPTFEAANPLAPIAISNPQWVYEDFNAARWHTEDATHDAGLYQTVNVTAGSNLTFSAWGQGWSSIEDNPMVSVDPANMRLQIGIDPLGGTNPNSPNVVWSGEQNPLNYFASFTVSATAVNDEITVFLRARPDADKAHNEVYWDAANLNGGTLLNADFEGSYSAYLGNTSLTVPDGWLPFYDDSSYDDLPARDNYLVYAAWSGDGGSTWSSPEILAENRSPSQGTTGAIRESAYPFISEDTDPPSVGIFYVYESGDPPPDTDFIRFGRPHLMVCELGTTECNDNPGLPLFSRQVIRPSFNLVLYIDPLVRDRGVLLWDSLQADNESKDVYATSIILR